MQPKRSFFLLTGVAVFACALVCSNTSNAALFGKKNKTEKPTKLSPAAQEAINNAQDYVRIGKFKEALALADKAISFDPKFGIPYMAKAYMVDQMGDAKKADQLYKKAILLSPNNGFVLNAVGVHTCAQGNTEQADAYFLKALSDNFYDTPYQAMENAGDCAFNVQNFPVAEARYRSALEVNPDSVLALEGMASISFTQSNILEARAFLQRREALGPLNTKLLELAVKIEKSAGDDRNAAIYQKRLDELKTFMSRPAGEGQSSQ
jgi:type IV pilus assembly protein PilF